MESKKFKITEDNISFGLGDSNQNLELSDSASLVFDLANKNTVIIFILFVVILILFFVYNRKVK